MSTRTPVAPLLAVQLLSGNNIGNITLSPVLLEKVRSCSFDCRA
jgi:hypothetical protein